MSLQSQTRSIHNDIKLRKVANLHVLGARTLGNCHFCRITEKQLQLGPYISGHGHNFHHFGSVHPLIVDFDTVYLPPGECS